MTKCSVLRVGVCEKQILFKVLLPTHCIQYKLSQALSNLILRLKKVVSGTVYKRHGSELTNSPVSGFKIRKCNWARHF